MSKSIMTDAELLAWIDAFVTQHSLPPTTFGRLTLGDANLISDLRAGRSLSLKRAKRICDFMTEYNPTTQSETKPRSEEHTSELQSLMRISYAVYCLKKKNTQRQKKS